ncbi:MAG: right-handed parallel beta-helix repeat-containing protein, partial [Thermoplasmata archaeon]
PRISKLFNSIFSIHFFEEVQLRRKSVISIFVVLFLILGSIPVLDFGTDIVLNVGATIREVGQGKTYSTIQEGVDAAQPGDTVFVYSGVYNETIIIDKTINLTGEDKNLVTLDGQGGYAFQIDADFINISGMTIINSTRGVSSSFRSNIMINDSIFVNNSMGIYLLYSNNCYVFNNEIVNSSQRGIECIGAGNITINWNHLNNSYMGIRFALDCYQNIISNNRIQNSTLYGIYIAQNIYNFSVDNNTCSNGETGIVMDGDTFDSCVINNTCINMSYAGIQMGSGGNNTVKSNVVFENSRNLYLVSNNNNTIINNTIKNGTWGVFLWKSNYNFFLNNEVFNHTDEGFRLTNSSRNILLNNTIYNNSRNIQTRSDSKGNMIINCTLSNPIDRDLVVGLDSTLVTLNTTFNKNKASVAPINSQLTVQWYLHAYILNPDLSPALGARVRVEDNENGSFRETYVTWYDGWKKWIVLTEYFQTSAGRTYFTPYNITAWNRTLTGYSDPEPKMEESEFVTLKLGEPVFRKKLYKGWNLVSLPLLQTDTSPSSIFSSILGKYDLIQVFNSTEEEWHSYPSGDLTEIDHTMGIWIHMKENTVWVINGSLPVRIPIPLNASGNGWNLIGYPTFYDNSIWDAFVTQQGDFDSVQDFEASDFADLWKHDHTGKPWDLNDLKLVKTGYGYWIHAINDCEVEVGPKKITGAMNIMEDPMEVGRYIIQLVSLGGVPRLPMLDAEFLIYDSSLGQNAIQSPILNNVTLQLGTQGSDMNCTFYDINDNWNVDAMDVFIVENGESDDKFILINRLTGENICTISFP